MGLLSTLALLDEGALFLHLRPQCSAQGWAQGSRESGMLYGEGSPQAWGGKPEASLRQDDLAESACRTSQELGRLPEGGETVLCRDGSQRLREGMRTSQGEGKICLKTGTSLAYGSIVWAQEEQQRGVGGGQMKGV